jgi:hypothetical protein
LKKRRGWDTLGASKGKGSGAPGPQEGGVLELIGFIEEHYGLEVQDAEVLPENLDSIENITRFVSRKLASTNGHAAG